jgi:hypothetical protein
MQIIGNEEECPFTYDKLVEISEEIENSELVDISMGDNKACVLVVRGYCPGHRKLLSKLTALEWDTKAIMYKMTKSQSRWLTRRRDTTCASRMLTEGGLPEW